MGNRFKPDTQLGDRFVRLLQMVEVLKTETLTLDQIAAEFGVCKRTVIRDLIVIERAGALVDITRTPIERGGPGGNPFGYRAHMESR